MAQVWEAPTSIVVNIFPASTPEVSTGTGIADETVELFPSFPNWLLPQQYAAPLAIAQTEELSTEISVIVLPDKYPLVLTATGVAEFAVDPFPNCPAPLFPQQYAAPSAIAHTVEYPAEIDVRTLFFKTPEVSTGMGALKRYSVDELPNCPAPLYPQQYAAPSAIAQVKLPPAAIALTFLPARKPVSGNSYGIVARSD
jgi:hypothetical protein